MHIYYHYFTLCEFFTSALTDGLLLESAWQQVPSRFFSVSWPTSTTLLVWMVFGCPPIFNSSNPLIKPLGIDPRAPTTIGNTVTFHCFFSSLAKSKYFSLISFSLIFTLWSVGARKSGLPVGIRRLLLFYSLDFFTSALADGFLLGFEWQQVSSSLQDSSQYTGRSLQFCSLDNLHLFRYF